MTAAKYQYAVIEDIGLALDCGTDLDFVHLYVGVNGHLMHDGGRRRAVRHAGEGPPPEGADDGGSAGDGTGTIFTRHDADAFVLKLVDDPGFRAACTEAISGDAVPFAHPPGRPG